MTRTATIAAMIPQLTFDDIAPSPPPVGKLAGFVLGAHLAPGIWLARRPDEEAPRAVARLFSPDAVNRRTLERFAHDAAQLRRVDHPGLARIHAAGIVGLPEGPAPYLVEELVSGDSLEKHAAATGLRGRLYLIASLAEALHAAHLKGVAHRDLTPERLVVDGSGRLRVRALGVAHITNDDVRAFSSAAGAPGRRVARLAPEQASGSLAVIDPRADVYAIGVIAYRLLTGRDPYELPGSAKSAASVINAEAPAPMDLERIFGRDALALDAEAIVFRALRKRPEARHQSASELATDLTRALAGETHTSRPASASRHLRLAARRRPGLAVAALAACLSLAGLSAFVGSALTPAGSAPDGTLLVREPAPERSRPAGTGRVIAVSLPERTERMAAADRLSSARQLAARGDADGAEDLLRTMIRRAASVRERLAGQRQLAELYASTGRAADAEPIALEALTRAVEAFGPDSGTARAAFRTLASVLEEAGRPGQEHQWWSVVAGAPAPPTL